MKHSTQLIIQIAVSLVLAVGTIAFFFAWGNDIGSSDVNAATAGPGFWAGSILTAIAVFVIDIAWLIGLSFWLAQKRLPHGDERPVINVEKILESRKEGSDKNKHEK